MHIYRIASGDVSLTAATPRTMIQLVTGSTRKAKIIEFGVSFSSVTSTDAPVLAEFLVETSAGTSSAGTNVALDLTDPAMIATSLITFTSTEPTGTTPAGPGPIRCTPVGGLFVYPFSQGVELVVPISTRLALRLNAPSSITLVNAYILVQE